MKLCYGVGKKGYINYLLPFLLYFHTLAGVVQKTCSFISQPLTLQDFWEYSGTKHLLKNYLTLSGWSYKEGISKAISTRKHLHRCPYPRESDSRIEMHPYPRSQELIISYYSSALTHKKHFLAKLEILVMCKIAATISFYSSSSFHC